MKKLLILLFLTSICIFLFSACGKQEDSFLNTDTVTDSVIGGAEEDTVEEHVHAYGEWQVVTAPTCLNAGERVRSCTCGEEETEIIPAHGHDLVNHGGLAATCTQDGYEPYETCTLCNYSTQIIIPAHGHDIRRHEAVQATCESAGHNAYESCSLCDYSTYIEIRALPHAVGDWIIQTAPTCETEGLKIKECTHCHTRLEFETLPSLGHDYGEWVITHPATCEEAGERTLSCTVCDNVIQTQILAPYGHTLSWCSTEDHHSQHCEECGYSSEQSPHEFENNVCTTCGYVNQFAQEGLSYKLINGTAYSVTGVGYETDPKIIIPAMHNGKPVTGITDYAFRNCTFSEIVIPESITRIGVGAFYNCTNLEKITLPFIGISREEYTFFGIIFGAAEYSENSVYVPESLKTVILSEAVTAVPDNAFYGCEHIQNIIFPEALRSIGNCSFAYCSGLKTVTLPESLEYIGANAFCGCALESVVFCNTQGWVSYDGEIRLGEVSVKDPVLIAGCLSEYYAGFIWIRG